MHSKTSAVAGLLAAVGVMIQGCATTTAGSATANPAAVTSASPSCSEAVTYVDPWVAFTPSLRDGDTMQVGERGWLSAPRSAADVTVSGSAAVDVTDESVASQTRCGQVLSTHSWVQVTAVAPGSVTFSTKGSSQTLQISVTD